MSLAAARLAGPPGGTKVEGMAVVAVVAVVAVDTVDHERCTLRCAPSAALTPRSPSCLGVTSRSIAVTASAQ